MRISKYEVYKLENGNSKICLLQEDIIRFPLAGYNCTVGAVFNKIENSSEPRLLDNTLPDYKLRERRSTLFCRVSDNEVINSIMSCHSVFQVNDGVYCTYGIFIGSLKNSTRDMRIPASLLTDIMVIARSPASVILKGSL